MLRYVRISLICLCKWECAAHIVSSLIMYSDWQSNKKFAHYIYVFIGLTYDIFDAVKLFAFTFFLLLFWWESFLRWIRLLLFLFLSCFSFSLLFKFLLFCQNFLFLSFLFKFPIGLFSESLRFLRFKCLFALCFFGSKLSSFSFCCILLSFHFLSCFTFFCLFIYFRFRNSLLLSFIRRGLPWLLRNLLFLRVGISWRRNFLNRFLSGRNFFYRAFSWGRSLSFNNFCFFNALFLCFLSVFMLLDRQKIFSFNFFRTWDDWNVLIGNFFDRSSLIWSYCLLRQLKFLSTSF